MKPFFSVVLAITLSIGNGLPLFLFAPHTARGQTLLTQTTWGGSGSDVAEGVASAIDDPW